MINFYVSELLNMQNMNFRFKIVLVLTNIVCYNFYMETLDKEYVKNMQPLVLAMVGDSVHTLWTRQRLAVTNKYKANALSREVARVVNAGNQSRIFHGIEDLLTEEELSIAKRARNTHIHSKAKNYSASEYIHATALEAVFGYLYLIRDLDRLQKLLEIGDKIDANRG